MDLDALAEMMGLEAEAEAPPAPLPEAAVASLRETCDRYVRGNPFKVGDLVTARKGFNVKGGGDPHIVVELVGDAMAPPPRFVGDESAHGKSFYGARLDIRVAHISRGQMIMHWAESWQYEPYALPVEAS